MKRLAAVMVAGGLAVATASGQYARVWTRPVPPATEVLDRLNLRLGWRTGVPIDGYRDGIATVQHRIEAARSMEHPVRRGHLAGEQECDGPGERTDQNQESAAKFHDGANPVER